MTDDSAAPSPSPSPTLLAPWGFALGLAITGNWILWKTDPGINWGLWVTGAIAALIIVARQRHGRVGAPSIAAAAWAIALAFGTAVTSDAHKAALLILASLVLLAIALVTAGEPSLTELQPRVALAAPFVAIAWALTGFVAEVAGTAHITRSTRASAAMRSALITVPVVILLVLLLAQADPLFAAMREGIENLFPLDEPARLAFIFVLLAVPLGAYASVARGTARSHGGSPGVGVAVGQLESRTLMTAVAAIMWLFVISAIVSLMKNPAARAGSGITYAEYARQGFAELSLAATVVIGTVLATRRAWLRDDPITRRIAAAALVGVGAMLAIAFMRVVRYEQAYGFTTLRLYAQGYMVVLACVLALLLREIARRAPSTKFAYHSATAALVLCAASIYFNTDAWIVHRNVERYRTSGEIDTAYLTQQLSNDATPALIEVLPALPEAERREITTRLLEDPRRTHKRDARWFAWNLRARDSAAALRKWYRESQPNGPAPR